ncbi:MAG: hemolysin family protein [Coriobacteriia bacterium]|nr:hemolysin family protein [Coriobacteriia bacterium]
MPVWLSLLLVVFFLAMNAFFVIAEFACVRVRKSQIDLAYEQGKRGAKNAKRVVENVNAYLAACQLGITLASLAIGWLGEPAFAELLRPLFNLVGMPEGLVVALSTAFGFALMTLFHVVVGEQIPKCLALFNTEAYALGTSTPLRWFYRITYPIMVVFTAITNGAVRLMGYDPTKESEAYSDDEIKLLIDESTESGLIGEEENEYVDNIFDLGDRDAESIMTPRTDLVCLDLEKSLEENRAVMLQYRYTRYPVCRGNKDRIVGFVHVKDLYTLPEDAQIDDIPVRPIEAVPENLSIPKLLQVLQNGHSKIAVVVDEHGGTAGIVTMSDVVEQIIGRIEDEYTHDVDEIRPVDEGVFEVEGSLSIAELVELVRIQPPEAEECETAAGLVMALLDRIPEEGDTVTLEDRGERAVLTVEEMDGHRVERLLLTVETKDPEE